MSSLLLVPALLGCDPLHKKKCEWYIEPEPKHKDLVEPGHVSLCLNNYEIKRQKCFFSAPLRWAESVYGKRFRYNDVEVDPGSMPRKIEKAEPCAND